LCCSSSFDDDINENELAVLAVELHEKDSMDEEDDILVQNKMEIRTTIKLYV
jgi:hypothetical protein